MVAFQSSFSLLLPLILLIALPGLELSTTTATKSFSLELIHRDSPESPFYPGNLTFRERVKSYSANSEFRAAYLMSIPNNNQATHPEMMPFVYRYHFSYLVELSIGTPPMRNLLILDTGSGLIWIQCQPCQTCYNQSSYKKLPCEHPLCKNASPIQCIDGECVYTLQYMDGSSTNGVASQETLTVISHNSPPLTRLLQVVYGCSDDNHGLREGKYGATAGILGLNKQPSSLILQLGSFILFRFSYCLPTPLPNGNYPATFLRFGIDMGYRGSPAQTTPFVNHSYLDYLNLLDVSVENKRLNYPPHTFDIRLDGTGGCVIDSGAELTFVHKDAYWKLHMEFKCYFDNYGLDRKECPSNSQYQLCYILPDDLNTFPSMTLHFQGADLKIAPENVFLISREEKWFILAIFPSDVITILLNINALTFAPENCCEDTG